MNENFLKGIICIQNVGNSGTLFLQSLFDSHPELLVLPALYTREIYNFWDNCNKQYSNKKIAEQFVEDPCQAYWFDSDERFRVIIDQNLNRMGDKENENLEIDKQKFLKNLIDELNKKKLSRRHFFLSVHFAFAKTAKLNYVKKFYIVFPFHTNPLKIAKYIEEDFSNIVFIHMVREPIKNLNSGQIHSMINHGRNTEISKWVFCDDQTCEIISGKHVKSVSVRLEDIHENPQEILNKVCDFLEIQWDKCLLNSTMLGKKWWNRPYSKKISGFDSNLHKKSSINTLTSFDIFRLEFLFYSWKKKWEYKTHKYVENNKIYLLIQYILIWIPLKIEFYPTKVYGPTDGYYIQSIFSPFKNNEIFLKEISIKYINIQRANKIFIYFLKTFFSLYIFITGLKNFIFSYLIIRYNYIKFLNLQKNNKNFYKKYLNILK